MSIEQGIATVKKDFIDVLNNEDGNELREDVKTYSEILVKLSRAKDNGAKQATDLGSFDGNIVPVKD